jgi:excinuclease ABC subunit A
MDFIRSEFANAPLSVQNGWNEKYFSFNSHFGQCDTCMGEGKIKVRYTEGTLVECPDCKGKRYKKDILSVLYRNKRIDEVLDLSVNEAIQFFDEYKEVIQVLKSLQKVGLGYLKLGQGTSTLSGGEAARLKLAKELITKRSGNMLYLLDEPTTGLHFSDIENLLKLLEELIYNGNTVISIEHNKQFAEYCDWKIELGPGAGKAGGYVISQGPVIRDGIPN